MLIARQFLLLLRCFLYSLRGKAGAWSGSLAGLAPVQLRTVGGADGSSRFEQLGGGEEGPGSSFRSTTLVQSAHRLPDVAALGRQRWGEAGSSLGKQCGPARAERNTRGRLFGPIRRTEDQPCRARQDAGENPCRALASKAAHMMGCSKKVLASEALASVNGTDKRRRARRELVQVVLKVCEGAHARNFSGRPLLELLEASLEQLLSVSGTPSSVRSTHAAAARCSGIRRQGEWPGPGCRHHRQFGSIHAFCEGVVAVPFGTTCKSQGRGRDAFVCAKCPSGT